MTDFAKSTGTKRSLWEYLTKGLSTDHTRFNTRRSRVVHPKDRTSLRGRLEWCMTPSWHHMWKLWGTLHQWNSKDPGRWMNSRNRWHQLSVNIRPKPLTIHWKRSKVMEQESEDDRRKIRDDILWHQKPSTKKQALPSPPTYNHVMTTSSSKLHP